MSSVDKHHRARFGTLLGTAPVRLDPSAIITTKSDILPLRVVPDAALQSGALAAAD